MASTTTIDIEDATSWKYRGEGAANLVVCYQGSNEFLAGKVLRLSKDVVKSNKLQASPPATLGKEHSVDLNGVNSNKIGDCNSGFQKLDKRNLATGTWGDAPVSGLKGAPIGSEGQVLGSTLDAANDSPLRSKAPGPALSEQEPRKQIGTLLSPLEQEIWAKFRTVALAKSATELTREYSKNVMGPLLGEALVNPGIPVRASADFNVSLTAAVKDSRPPRWQKEGPLRLISGFALLIADHASSPGGGLAQSNGQRDGEPVQERGPSICVEIKPKAGFLPTSECISIGNQVKREKTRYELMQHWKAQQGKVDAVSSYNPLDLFSPDPTHVRRAIDSLFDHPQNNLRVFVDGELLEWKSRDSSTGAVSLDGVEEVLKGFCDPVEGSRVTVLKELLTQRLAGSVTLERLRAAQMLDRHDIEGVIHVYWALFGHPPDERTSEDLPPATRRLLDLPRESQLDILRDFLTATTAKDCGLMLTFGAVKAEEVGKLPASEDSQTTVHAVRGRSYLCKAAYVDLDLKPLRKLPKYWELDQQIVASYKAGMLESQSV